MRFFFFQAEDGIRDIGVTGVQTCALPISGLTGAAVASPGLGCAGGAAPPVAEGLLRPGGSVGLFAFASWRTRFGRTGAAEIGRASCGKECRSRWSPYH